MFAGKEILPFRTSYPAGAPAAFCEEKFRRRAEYIHRLGQFNRALRPHLIDGHGTQELLDSIQASRNAWRQYRVHVDDHRCHKSAADKRG